MGECYIDRLPIELLAAILEEHSVQEQVAPFVDSQVCRRWHGVTQLWPRVWSYIVIRSMPEHVASISRLKTFLKLKRSCDSPLHVDLAYPSLMVGATSSITTRLFLYPAITRIQNLHLEGPGALPDAIRTVDSVPNLRSLQLRQCNQGQPLKFRLGAKSFPLLDELVVHGMSLPRLTLGSPVPLRTLSLSYLQQATWAAVLSECRETLVEVLLDRCKLPLPARIHLPNLKYLALSNMLDFRNDLVAPNLTTFHERPDHLESLKLPFTFSSLIEYACRGSYPSVDDGPLSEGFLLPNLERLALWGTWKGIREVLWELASHPQAVPRLNIIELAREDGGDLSDSQWAELGGLFARTPLSSTLKRKTDSRASHISFRFSLTRRCLLKA